MKDLTLQSLTLQSPPARKALTGTSNLLTESMAIEDKPSAVSIDSTAGIPAWITEARADFEEQIGELDMLIMDAAPSPQAPYVWVAHATKNSDKPKQQVIGACSVTNIVESEQDNIGAAIGPAMSAVEYYYLFERRKLKQGIEGQPSEYPDPVGDVKLVRAPQHGRIGTREGDTTPRYFANAGFTGVDKYEFEVMVLGKPVRVIEYMNVVKYLQDTVTYQRVCGKRPYWRIAESGQPDPSSSDYAAWQSSANLSALIAAAQQSLAGLTDLPSTALGQTTGEGTSAQITLDQNAAGHGWYIDPTPLDSSDDYLPTSNPEVWQAKAGSAAAGKMDMLSVLLHEYGHALGLEHSADARDFMATTLQPGERRLPSSEEL